MSAPERALYFIRRGWSPIPIPRGEKGPVFDGWNKVRISENEVPAYFSAPGLNVGIQLGAASQWLVDVDLDTREAIDLAPRFLPSTGSMFGRPGKPRSHWLYYAKGAEAIRVQQQLPTDTKRVSIVELRSDNLQTVFPGSVHPSGEEIVWHHEGEPAAIDANELENAVRMLGEAAKLMRSGWTAEAACATARMGRVVEEPVQPKAPRVVGEFDEAVAKYNADHRLDLPKSRGDCPGCDHRGCFGQTPNDDQRWYCFSASHSQPGVQGTLGFHGDALDLDAHRRGMSRAEMLREGGYLKRQEAKAAQGEAVPSTAAGTRHRTLTMAELLAEWDKAPENRFLETGLSVLDKPLGGGLPVGFTTMILAGTNVGKSEFARQVGRRAGLLGHHVLHLDGELSDLVMGDRWISQAADVAAAVLTKRESWTSGQVEAIEMAKRELASLPIRTAFLDPIPETELEQVIRNAVAEMPAGKPKLVIVDSAHHFSFGFDALSRREQVEGFVRWLNRVARDLGVAMMVIAEQGRAKPGEKQAALGAESRSLEFQAHVSLRLEEVDEVDDQLAGDASESWERRVKLTVIKNRIGRKGRVDDDVIFTGPCWDMHTSGKIDERAESIVEWLADNKNDWATARGIEKGLKKKNGSLTPLLRKLANEGLLDSISVKGQAETSRKYRLRSAQNGDTD
jgi:replicative DNA helicase